MEHQDQMRIETKQSSRRMFLLNLAHTGLLWGLTAIRGRAWASGSRDYPQGIREVKGTVTLNNLEAKPGMIVQPGDVILTAADSSVVFVAETDVFLLREQTRLEFSESLIKAEDKGSARILRLVTGKMMAVFGKGRKQIETPAAIIGVRGTGLYAEAEEGQSYVCACYGQIAVQSKHHPSASETLRTRHHEQARFIYAAPENQTEGQDSAWIKTAPMRNHEDRELIHLESLVGRQPPFMGMVDQKPDQKKDRRENGGGY